MQNDDRARKSHDEYGRAKRPKSVEITGYCTSDPSYERREPGTLQPQRKYYQVKRNPDFVNECHRSIATASPQKQSHSFHPPPSDW
jgi:hypothetical protein